jgi:hypothetical protein
MQSMRRIREDEKKRNRVAMLAATAAQVTNQPRKARSYRPS